MIIGLTGGVGMGKSTAAKMLRLHRIPVFDADLWVHRALGKNGAAVDEIRAAFPSSYDPKNNKILRPVLGQIVFQNAAARRKLESILHPMVRAAEIRFIKRHKNSRSKMIVLDIPLLFETGADALCDAVICVSAPEFVQHARVMKRPGMTPEKLKAIRAAQMDDADRRARADFILETGNGMRAAWKDLQGFVHALKQMHVRNRP